MESFCFRIMTELKSKDPKNSLQNKFLQPVVIISRFKILVRCEWIVFLRVGRAGRTVGTGRTVYKKGPLTFLF